MIRGLFLLSTIPRYLHTSSALRAVDKAALSKLRKRTGISFVNCKKALDKFDNDVAKAEVWLKEEAQKQGWAKATKLGGRSMASGLIGVRLEGDMASMVEINCETDFVARNEKFQNLVNKVSDVILEKGKEAESAKLYWEKDEFNKVTIENGQSISDVVALEVGNLGENMAAKRGVVLRAGEFRVGHYVHTVGSKQSDSGKCILGKYASIMRYQQPTPVEGQKVPLEEMVRQLCQHIVGMNPVALGTPDDEPCENKDNETKMIHQEFLLDPSLTVNEVLQQNGIEINDFVRFEVGEILESEKSEEKDSAELRQSA